MFAILYDKASGKVKSVVSVARAGGESPDSGEEVLYSDEDLPLGASIYDVSKGSPKGSLEKRSRGEFTLIHRRSLGDVFMSLLSVAAYVRETREPILYATAEGIRPLLERIPFLSGTVAADGTNSVHAVKRWDLEEVVHRDDDETKYDAFARTLLNRSLLESEYQDFLTPTLRDGELRWAKDLLETFGKETGLENTPVVALATSLSPYRRWGFEKALITANPNVRFVRLGRERDALSDLRREQTKNVLDLRGRTTVPQMLSLLKVCDGAGVEDTALLHAALAMDVPYFCVFGGVHRAASLIPNVWKERVVAVETTNIPTDYPQFVHCQNVPCWDGTRHDCFGTDSEKWCMKALDAEQIQPRVEAFLKHIEARKTRQGSPARLKKSNRPFRLAVVMVGGMGDDLVKRNVLRQVLPRIRRDLSSSVIEAYVRQDYPLFRVPEIKEQFERVFVAGTVLSQQAIVEQCLNSREYDAVLDVRYEAQWLESGKGEWQGHRLQGKDSGEFVEDHLCRTFAQWKREPDGRALPLPTAFEGISPSRSPRFLAGRGEERRFLEKTFEGWKEPFVIVANGTDPTFRQTLTKRLGEPFLKELLHRLDSAGCRTVQVGVEGTEAVSFTPKTARNHLNLVGKTSLEGLLWLLQRAKRTQGIYLGGDNGTTHLAGQIGVPGVVLFGPTSPEFWTYSEHTSFVAEGVTCGRRPCHGAADWHLTCPAGKMFEGEAECMSRFAQPDIMLEFLNEFVRLRSLMGNRRQTFGWMTAKVALGDLLSETPDIEEWRHRNVRAVLNLSGKRRLSPDVKERFSCEEIPLWLGMENVLGAFDAAYRTLESSVKDLMPTLILGNGGQTEGLFVAWWAKTHGTVLERGLRRLESRLGSVERMSSWMSVAKAWLGESK